MLLMNDFGGTCNSALLDYGKQGQFDLFKKIVKGFSVVAHDDNQSYSIEDIEISGGSFDSGYVSSKYIIKNLSTGTTDKADWIDFCTSFDVFKNETLNNLISMEDRQSADFSGDLSKYVNNIVFNNDYGFGRIAGLSGETYAVEYELDTGYIGLNISDNSTAILNKKASSKIDMLKYVNPHI